MGRRMVLMAAGAVFSCLNMLAQWQPAGDKIRTPWAADVRADLALPDYPRPMMERHEWKSLNGLWDYAIRPRGEAAMGAVDGQILVPFPVESSLSGVMRMVGDQQELWYSHRFTVPAGWKGQRVLLHFGAVDWQADVYLNGIRLGSHQGGYTGFSFDITPYLSKKEQLLQVRVWDPSDKGYQPRGKQHVEPRGIWYTPVTGIWQTVWIEPVGERHISSLRILPDIDRRMLCVSAQTEGTSLGDIVKVTVKDGGQVVAESSSAVDAAVELYLQDMKLWSPDMPFLYDVQVELLSKGKAVDRVESYVAMRKISVGRDAAGVVRMLLNNKALFQFGPLDQGYWPDGLYTAPTDEALKFDIEKTKELGFNMIRKHMKVEPDRWYTWCDRLGMLVWQDMPSGDKSPKWQTRQFFDGEEMERSATSEADFRQEWREIIDNLYNHPCIVVWTPFNEAWGQFKTREIADWTKAYDPSRLVNAASGGNHYPHAGDLLDVHNYPAPAMKFSDSTRVNVLGEYGGLGLVKEEHVWQQEKNWGYTKLKNEQEVTDLYVKYAHELLDLIPKGFSAAVYTQTTDVEIELNGLYTYDRKLLKMDAEAIRKVNQAICRSLDK